MIASEKHTELKQDNPFVGLRPFEREEALYFFGRKAQTTELLSKLHETRFVAIVGSSGSGKSSLIRAGLIPSLEAGFLIEARFNWKIIVMKPGESPIYNLARVVSEQMNRETDIQVLYRNFKDRGAEAVMEAISPMLYDGETNCFLLVDQFEEIFRFINEEATPDKIDEANEFVDIMLKLSQQEVLPIYVVMTMRSDFIGDCVKFYGLPQALNNCQYLIPRLNRQELRQVITGPVRLFGGRINERLTDLLLNSIQEKEDELPILQHLLMRMWNYEYNVEHSGDLDLADYKGVNGIEKALSDHADEALDELDDKQRAVAKVLFQCLTKVDNNQRKIRRPAHISEIARVASTSAEVIHEVMEFFVRDNRCFLVKNKLEDENDYLIDISHESLIRNWSTLIEWVEEETNAAEAYLMLVESVALFRKEEKDLLSEREIHRIDSNLSKYKFTKIWAARYDKENFDEALDYLKYSKKSVAEAASRKKSIRILVGFLAVAVLISITWGVTLFFNNEEITRQKDLAEIQEKLAKENAEEADRQSEIAEKKAEEARKSEEKARESEMKARKAEEEAKISEKEAKLERERALIAREKAEINALAARRSEQEALDQKAKAELERFIADSARAVALYEKKLADSLAKITRLQYENQRGLTERELLSGKARYLAREAEDVEDIELQAAMYVMAFKIMQEVNASDRITVEIVGSFLNFYYDKIQGQKIYDLSPKHRVIGAQKFSRNYEKEIWVFTEREILVYSNNYKLQKGLQLRLLEDERITCFDLSSTSSIGVCGTSKGRIIYFDVKNFKVEKYETTAMPAIRRVQCFGESDNVEGSVVLIFDGRSRQAVTNSKSVDIELNKNGDFFALVDNGLVYNVPTDTKQVLYLQTEPKGKGQLLHTMPIDNQMWDFQFGDEGKVFGSYSHQTDSLRLFGVGSQGKIKKVFTAKLPYAPQVLELIEDVLVYISNDRFSLILPEENMAILNMAIQQKGNVVGLLSNRLKDPTAFEIINDLGHVIFLDVDYEDNLEQVVLPMARNFSYDEWEKYVGGSQEYQKIHENKPIPR